MHSSLGRSVPKMVIHFIIKQITNFISSKEFKRRVTDFLFDVVDDVVNLAYKNMTKEK